MSVYPVVMNGNKKSISAAKSAVDLAVSRLVCPTLILNIISASMFIPCGKMVGMVQSWEIGVLFLIGGAGKLKLSYVIFAQIFILKLMYF